ncbi:MAG: HAD family hydrolase [Ignavibacteriales bacterium]|nr:HAD family hydrolase [Ignavibacteriales bacterium]
MIHFNTYKHIIWDWNGTLLDDLELCVSLINNILTERNLPELSKEAYQNIFTFPVIDYYKEAGLNFETESFEEVGRIWMDGYEENKHTCHVMRGAKNFLAKIKSLHIRQSVLSAYSQHTLVEIIKSHGLLDYFDHVKGLDHIYATSKVGLGKELMAALQLQEGEALLIGDTLHDKDVALEIGADCILVAKGHQSFERLTASGVPVFHSLEEVLPYL